MLMEHSATTLIVVGSVFLIGRAMLRSMRRNGQYRRAYHGWFVWVWMLLGGLVGMAAAPLVTMPQYAGGVFGFGLLCGWAIGTAHGLVMLPFFRPPAPPSHDPDAG
jgi:hypothetical protein